MLSPLSNTIAMRLMGLFFQGYRETVVMEDLSKRWQKLSLTDTEGDKFDLSKEKQILEFFLGGSSLPKEQLTLRCWQKHSDPYGEHDEILR